jgi:hypothetical protein
LVGLATAELLRQPACFLLTLASVTFTVALPMVTAIQLGQQGHLARDSALAFEFVFGAMLAGYAACSTLHRECQSGTVLTILSKPVGRNAFFTAKFVAVGLLVLVFVVASTAAALLGARLTPVYFETDSLGAGIVLLVPAAAFLPAAAFNFRRGRSFVSLAQMFLTAALILAVAAIACFDRSGHIVAFGSLMDWRLIPACLLEGVALLLLAALALSLSTRLNVAPTVAILAVFLFVGLVSDYLVNRLPASPALRFTFRALLPDLQAFWSADELSGGGAVTRAAVRHAAAYAVCYTTGIFCLGLAAFRSRQF